MGISSQSVNAAVFNASEQGTSAGFVFLDRSKPEKDDQVQVIKDRHAIKSTINDIVT